MSIKKITLANFFNKLKSQGLKYRMLSILSQGLKYKVTIEPTGLRLIVYGTLANFLFKNLY
jgi:hypothetical protein